MRATAKAILFGGDRKRPDEFEDEIGNLIESVIH